MSTVEIRLTGNREDCLTVVALLSHAAPVEVKTTRPAHRGGPGARRQRIYAEIHTRHRTHKERTQ